MAVSLFSCVSNQRKRLLLEEPYVCLGTFTTRETLSPSKPIFSHHNKNEARRARDRRHASAAERLPFSTPRVRRQARSSLARETVVQTLGDLEARLEQANNYLVLLSPNSGHLLPKVQLSPELDP